MARHPALSKFNRLVLLQLAMLLMIAVGLSIFYGAFVSISAVLGGMVCVLPSWVFAQIYFRNSGAQAAKKIVLNFYWGEMVKLAFTMALFALIFAHIKVSGVAFFVGFMVMQSTLWVAPLFFDTKNG